MGNNIENQEYRAIRSILEGTAKDTCLDFFNSFVKNLSIALNTNTAWVTEFLPANNRLRTLSFYHNGD
jgi:hypothetical protein